MALGRLNLRFEPSRAVSMRHFHCVSKNRRPFSVIRYRPRVPSAVDIAYLAEGKIPQPTRGSNPFLQGFSRLTS